MDPDSTKTIIQVIVLVALIALSAFFSGAETALTTVNKIKLKTLADDGDKKAARTIKVISTPKKMLSAILIGNNIVNLSASSLATIVATKMLGSKGAGIATGILTFLILIFGEISPKSMASINSLTLSCKVSGIIGLLMKLLTPVIAIVNFFSGIFMRILGVDPDFKDVIITQDEIRTIVDVSHESGAIEEDERDMIHKVFDFSDATAKETMIPRIDMTMISVDASASDLFKLFKECMYTRVPVFDGEPDNVIGMVNIKDMIAYPDWDAFVIKEHLRNVYYTYEQKDISDLFDEMRDKGMAMAMVLDEYGALSGMITLEDLIEEIVGEIRDEYDTDEEDDIVELGEREYRVLGSANLEDLCHKLPLGFTSDDYDTIGGYLTGAFDHFPHVGEIYVSEQGHILRVLEVHHMRITRINVRLAAPAEEESKTE